MTQTLSDQSSLRVERRASAVWAVVGVLVVAVTAPLGVATRAFAFSQPSDYVKYPFNSDPLRLGGGSGRFYTGSPADGYSCENCHSAHTPYSFPIVQTGLPLDGYVPGQMYKIEISSPQANIQLAASRMANNDAVSTLTAEFVAEDAGPAGTVDFPSMSDRDVKKFPGQWCEGAAPLEAGGSPNDYGMNIYAVDTNSISLEITLDKNQNQPDKYGPCKVGRGKNADGVDNERRCVIAMKPCGVQSVKFMWTAPDKWSGTIWFSLGFVATYARSSQPNDDDYVTTMNIPLNPAFGGPTHETKLESGCSVVTGPSALNALGQRGVMTRGVIVVTLWLGTFLVARSRQRRNNATRAHSLPFWAALFVALVCFAGAGCTDDSKGLIADPPFPVGAYESIGCRGDCDLPVTCRKCAWPDAGTAESLAEGKKLAKTKMSTSAPTMATGTAGTLDPFGAGAAGTADIGSMTPATGTKSLGTVTATFTTSQPADFVSSYVINKCNRMCSYHYLTAWIENERGEFVRWVFEQKGMYLISIETFYGLGSDCQWPLETVRPDAVASATIEQHTAHKIVWDGLYGNGHKAAPAGLYYLRIEVVIDEAPAHKIPVSKLPIMFGDPAPATMMFPPEPAHTGVTLTYTPNP